MKTIQCPGAPAVAGFWFLGNWWAGCNLNDAASPCWACATIQCRLCRAEKKEHGRRSSPAREVERRKVKKGPADGELWDWDKQKENLAMVRRKKIKRASNKRSWAKRKSVKVCVWDGLARAPNEDWQVTVTELMIPVATPLVLGRCFVLAGPRAVCLGVWALVWFWFGVDSCGGAWSKGKELGIPDGRSSGLAGLPSARKNKKYQPRHGQKPAQSRTNAPSHGPFPEKLVSFFGQTQFSHAILVVCGSLNLAWVLTWSDRQVPRQKNKRNKKN